MFEIRGWEQLLCLGTAAAPDGSFIFQHPSCSPLSASKVIDLSHPLTRSVEGPDANAAIIVPAAKPAAAPPAKRALTGKQKKRLTKLAERLAKQDARPALYASLRYDCVGRFVIRATNASPCVQQECHHSRSAQTAAWHIYSGTGTTHCCLQ